MFFELFLDEFCFVGGFCDWVICLILMGGV